MKCSKNLPFGFNAPEDSPGFLLWQTTISWQRLIKKALGPYNISHAQFVIMAILLFWQGKNKKVVQIDIINMSKLDKMTVSKALKKLTEIGLIIRYECLEDTRAKLVQLTKSGVVLAKKLIPIVESIDEIFFGPLKKNEQQGLVMILQKLVVDNNE